MGRVGNGKSMTSFIFGFFFGYRCRPPINLGVLAFESFVAK